MLTKMPLNKSLKVMCIEVGIFFALLAIATQLTVNVWEYFVLRSELSKINSSLHVLKNTLSSISSQYYKVNKELSEINCVESVYMAPDGNELEKRSCMITRKTIK